ncbi:PREDICTED: myotubularin-related protein 14, partial [Condylura cristata]|uniref:myotubularin-related protein 14 n=1 Tax=Condylura cristata TaxID=143302 RepID=UPI0003347721
AAASAGTSASSGHPPPQEPGLGELLEEFSRTQYRAKDCSGTGGSKVERIEKRCLELFGRDYCYSVIRNVNGDICGHYPQHIVFLEYESSEKEKDTFQSTVQVSKLQDLVYRSKTARCRGRFVCPVILFKGKVSAEAEVGARVPRSRATGFTQGLRASASSVAALGSRGSMERVDALCALQQVAACARGYTQALSQADGRCGLESVGRTPGADSPYCLTGLWGQGAAGQCHGGSGGADDAWADAEDVAEEDCALRSSETHLFDKVRGYDIKLLRYLSVKYICDLMVENKKVKFGMNVTSSEKVDKAQRYADFTLLSIPYPGCEFFKEYKDRDYIAEGLVFNWNQDYVDAPLSIPDFLTGSLNIDWSQYQSWDLVQQTQNYLKLLLSIINSDDDRGLLVHCISGWDRTPLFISLLRLSLWADGLIHTSLKPAEILYLTVAYDWFLFGHMLVDRLSKGEEIFFFCFNFLKHIISEEFSALKTQRRKSLPTRDGFTLEDLCMLRRKDRGSTTSLGSDFSLVMESSPGAAGSFTYETVELVPAGAQTQAAWRKSHSSPPQSVLWSRPLPAEDRPLCQQGLVEARSSSSSSSNHSDNFFRMGSSPLEVPKPRSVDHPLPGSSLSTDFGSWQMVTGCGSIQERAVLHTDASLPFSCPDELPGSCLLAALSQRQTRLQEVRSAFLATYSSTVGLRAAPSPSGAIGGLLEQFVRGVGLRGASSSAL